MSADLVTILWCVGVVKSRREQYAEQTRQALVEAAAEAFAQHGFAATSMADIAEAARVTKGAVYHHFSDKCAVFEAALKQCDEAAQQKVLHAVAEHPDDLWSGILAALDTALEVCADPIAGRLIYAEGPIALGWTRWRECEDEYTYGNIRSLLDAAMQAGIYPDDVPAAAMAQVMTGMITHAGVALAETSTENRQQTHREIYTAIRRLLEGTKIK